MAEERYNLKNPAVKRILQEVKEMQSNPSEDFMSLPLEVFFTRMPNFFFFLLITYSERVWYFLGTILMDWDFFSYRNWELLLPVIYLLTVDFYFLFIN